MAQFGARIEPFARFETVPGRELEQYLRGEQSLGRVPGTVDPDAIASLLTGAALHEAFQASFADREIHDADELARRWVAAFALSA